MNIPSPLIPASSQARDLDQLFQVVLIISVAIFLVVAGLVIYNAFRYRQRPGDALPKQDHGNHRLEIAWTIVPLIIVTVMFLLSVRTMHLVDPLPLDRKPDIDIVAHQWWWEAHYPATGAVTANEIHIPAGKKLLFRITSADVVHDFWVPQLAQKIDAVPGQMNVAWISADRPGVYLGACAEYCGAEHAWMRVRVVAQPPAEFERWQQHQLRLPAAPTSEQASRGFHVFMNRPCSNCHRIAGTPAQGRIGPDLTHLGSRKTLAAGVLANNPGNLAAWVTVPQQYKPGSNMPNFQFDPQQLKDLIAYLKELK